MSKAAGQRSTNSFEESFVLFVEHGIMLDALEHVLKEANPLVQELYLGTVENLQAQEAVEVNQLLTQTLEVQPVGS
jgi:hypothetical protein